MKNKLRYFLFTVLYSFICGMVVMSMILMGKVNLSGIVSIICLLIVVFDGLKKLRR